jgi:hypothetical protein
MQPESIKNKDTEGTIMRRTEHRITALETARATILGHPDETVSCSILNFSKSGMCIEVREPIPEGKIVKVEWEDSFLVGRARRNALEQQRFQIGLELLYCSQWSEPLKETLESAEVSAILP